MRQRLLCLTQDAAAALLTKALQLKTGDADDTSSHGGTFLLQSVSSYAIGKDAAMGRAAAASSRKEWCRTDTAEEFRQQFENQRGLACYPQ